MSFRNDENLENFDVEEDASKARDPFRIFNAALTGQHSTCDPSVAGRRVLCFSRSD